MTVSSCVCVASSSRDSVSTSFIVDNESLRLLRSNSMHADMRPFCPSFPVAFKIFGDWWSLLGCCPGDNWGEGWAVVMDAVAPTALASLIIFLVTGGVDSPCSNMCPGSVRDRATSWNPLRRLMLRVQPPYPARSRSRTVSLRDRLAMCCAAQDLPVNNKRGRAGRIFVLRSRTGWCNRF